MPMKFNSYDEINDFVISIDCNFFYLKTINMISRISFIKEMHNNLKKKNYIQKICFLILIKTLI